MPTIHFLREQLDVDCPTGIILRDAALDAGVELYGLKGKLGNCGGCGQCSTCFVAVAGQGEDTCLTPRTAPEQRFLKKRPPSWRLACQAVIRDSLVVVTRPQAGWPGGDEALAAAASAMPADATPIDVMPVDVVSSPQDGAHQDRQDDGDGQDGGDEVETGER
ncbi:2Fe-2S iron-sulfur cluster-binding protein [Candidatus Synechococcus spongiarum]|uniref:Ferredoxin n=1 Tax=Candidatus Synechococcus spongiarum TaxID=431041 RepID=A0A165AGT1_9SYNE|nr:2Fe-2S iron-sulfur cluster-binding protein [Candidatus Synechococcus spongiarum]SAY39347.1 Ferredoxin [Candidatus Synechococcus spongiarum]